MRIRLDEYNTSYTSKQYKSPHSAVLYQQTHVRPPLLDLVGVRLRGVVLGWCREDGLLDAEVARVPVLLVEDGRGRDLVGVELAPVPRRLLSPLAVWRYRD